MSLTGHINAVRDVKLSTDFTYMYTCSEDCTVKCWDLTTNKAIRNYHGHMSGVYCLAIHPNQNIIATGGRDSAVRLWDIRTRRQIHAMTGHKDTVFSIIMQEDEPQIVSGSADKTVRIWDISTGKKMKTITNHKKTIRSMLFHPKEYTFVTAAADNVKLWKCPESMFLRNFDQYLYSNPSSSGIGIVNSVATNGDDILVAGSDDGYLNFWDWDSGRMFQRIKSRPQPGSISSESGIFACKFDYSGLRLITAECDKTIKIWQRADEDEMKEEIES